MRRALAVLVGAAVAALGAVILGEYPLQGGVALIAGLVFGMLVGQSVVSTARDRGGVLTTAAALFAGAGLVWAGWISTGHELSLLAAEGWGAVAVGVLAAVVTSARWKPAAGSRREP